MDIVGMTSIVFALSSVAILWFAPPRIEAIVAWSVAVLIFFWAAALPLSYPQPGNIPSGEHTVLGARIDIDKAIYVLLDTPGEPRYFVLPYTKGQAEALQNAIDAAQGQQGGVKGKFKEDGEPGEFRAINVKEPEDKPIERPMFSE